jgi:myo-inositol-1-phosphate synthase
MSNSKREMRLYSKNKINIGGDLDALVMLEERKLSYIEKVIEINDNEF